MLLKLLKNYDRIIIEVIKNKFSISSAKIYGENIKSI